MHDIKDIRKNPDKYRESQRKRGQDPGIIDDLLELDGFSRAFQTIEQTAQSKRNKLSDEYGRLKALQKKGEATYVAVEDGVPYTYAIETGMKFIEAEQMLVDIDESIAKSDLRIAMMDAEQARMVEGWAKQMGFANADALVEEMKKEADSGEKTSG